MQKHAGAIAPEGSLQIHLYEWRNVISRTQFAIARTDWKLHLKVQNDFLKLRFRARHEHTDSERRCTSDLKHAPMIFDDANDEDADAPDFAAGGKYFDGVPGEIWAAPNCLWTSQLGGRGGS